MSKRVCDGGVWTGFLALNEYEDGLVFKEKLEDAMDAITCIAGNDEVETLRILMYATALQAAFLHADDNPDSWLPMMNETMTGLVRKHYADGHRRGMSVQPFSHSLFFQSETFLIESHFLAISSVFPL